MVRVVRTPGPPGQLRPFMRSGFECSVGAGISSTTFSRLVVRYDYSQKHSLDGCTDRQVHRDRSGRESCRPPHTVSQPYLSVIGVELLFDAGEICDDGVPVSSSAQLTAKSHVFARFLAQRHPAGRGLGQRRHRRHPYIISLAVEQLLSSARAVPD